MIANKKPDLPADVIARLDDLLGRAGDADTAGNGELSMALSEEAWAEIPEPKTEWNFYPQTISRGTVEVIPEIGQCAALPVWLDRMYKTHFDPDRIDPYTNLVAGNSLYKCGQLDEAKEAFIRVLDRGGPEYFSGEYKRYLPFAQKD